MKPNDPAYWMLFDGFESKPNLEIYDPDCYICNDPEFAQMGLPLCKPCLICGAHVAADDYICNDGHVQPQDPTEFKLVPLRKAAWEFKQFAKNAIERLQTKW